MSGIRPSINDDVRDEIMGRSVDLEGISDLIVQHLRCTHTLTTWKRK
jgi:hypothetical protein